MTKILEIKNLSKKYHTQEGEILAIESINMEVNKGDFIALVEIGRASCRERV